MVVSGLVSLRVTLNRFVTNSHQAVKLWSCFTCELVTLEGPLLATFHIHASEAFCRKIVMLVLVTLRLLCVQYNKNYEHESSILTTYVGLARSAKSQKLLMPNSFFLLSRYWRIFAPLVKIKRAVLFTRAFI